MAVSVFGFRVVWGLRVFRVLGGLQGFGFRV